MENSASNITHHTTTSATAHATTKRNTTMSMSSDSLDFFYSPYPFDSPLQQQQQQQQPLPVLEPSPDSRTVPAAAASSAAAAGAVTKKKKILSNNNTQNYLSYLATTPPSSACDASALPLPPPPPPPQTAAHLMMLRCWNEERMLVGGGHDGRVAEEEDEVEDSPGRRSKSLIKKQKRVIKKVAVGLRISQVILCFLSFFVMISDKTKGWTGDSYYRYPEYRYLVGVNIVGCIHSGVEACDMAYCLLTGGKHVLISCCSFRYYLDFFIDQIVAYLLMSATSAAATRKSEWVSNWGKDEFTNMANASICLSFFAFFAFAFTCLFSALNFITTTT